MGSSGFQFNRLTHYVFFLSVLVPYLIVAGFRFPFFGFSLSFVLLLSFIYFSREKRSREVTIFYFLSLIFSFFIVYRSDFPLTLFNISAVIWFGSLMSMPSFNFGLFHVVVAPFYLLVQSISATGLFSLMPFSKNKSIFGKTMDNMSKILFSLIISLIILLLTVPLLSFSNPIFSNLVSYVTSFFDLTKLVDILFSPLNFIRVVMFGFLFVFLPRVIFFARQADSGGVILIKRVKDVLVLPSLLMVLLLTVFIITQLQLYFASAQSLAEMAITNSQATREVFGHLSVVALIIFLLAYNSPTKRINRYLIIQAFFLAFVALKSDWDYIDKFGLTEKRLYGLAVVGWIVGLMIVLGWKILSKNRVNISYIAILFSGLVLMLVNIANFDYLIYHVNSARTGEGKDYYYLSYLSSDARSYKDHLENLQSLVENNPNEYKYIDAGRVLVSNITDLQYKYAVDFDLREFNISEYLEYLSVKDVETQRYYSEVFVVSPVLEEIKVRVQPSLPSPVLVQ